MGFAGDRAAPWPGGPRTLVRAPYGSDEFEGDCSGGIPLSLAGRDRGADAAGERRQDLVVVPYPHHADRQQWRNAEPLVAAGRAVLVEEGDLDPERFRSEVLAR
ncbi:MAG TPA: glycosyltransferase, partial [Planctomycetota bacterium]|nr:glycosyltransferase [Planctomycetota bacterium]